MHLPAWQQTLFYVLAFASVGVMLLQIFLRARQWRKGKPIDWKPIALRGVWKYVLAQRKVRNSRRKSGAPMHMMIFYGFLALLLATTLLAINTYSPWKFHKGTYFLVYELTFDVLGLVFVIGCAWALVRRLWFRPPTLTQFASDTWAIALLFVIGLTGFLLEGARIGNTHVGPQDWHAFSPVGLAFYQFVGGASDELYIGIWWVHAALVFTFFAIIPRLRIRHIVLAILNSFGAEEQHPGVLKPISIEEVEKTGQIGVAIAQDYSRWHLMSLDACMECGRCTEVCPAWNVGKVLNPKMVVQDIRRAEAKGLPVAEAVTEEALWACTTCNACVEACPVLIRHVDMIVDARRNLVAEGKFSGTGATMLRQVGSTGHAWGQPANSREDWMQGLDIPLCRNGAEFDVILWVGCAGATDPGAVKTTKAVASLLRKAGVKFACLGQEESCTGDPARRTGDEFLFQEKAQTNVSVFEKYNIQKIVTPCPHCFNTFTNEYGQFGGKLVVEHHTQFLARLVEEGKLNAANAENSTLHDPCYLARVNNESDAPRRLLGKQTTLNDDIYPQHESGLNEPVQFARKTLCCGAGGGRMWMEEPPNQRPGNRRAEQLLATGAKNIAVACPFCRIMLDASIKQVTQEEIRLVDLAEMLQEANSS